MTKYLKDGVIPKKHGYSENINIFSYESMFVIWCDTSVKIG